MDTPVDASAVLAQWQQRESEARARFLPPGVSRPDQIAGKSGLQVIQGLLTGELPPPHIADSLDFALVEAAFGEATFQGKPLLRYYNPLGTVHGGWIATLLDSCVGCAVHTTLPVGKAYTTAELKVNYVRAVTDKVPLVRAIGKVIHAGGRMATAEGRLVGPDGKLYAHASTTCFIFDAS